MGSSGIKQETPPSPPSRPWTEKDSELCAVNWTRGGFRPKLGPNGPVLLLNPKVMIPHILGHYHIMTIGLKSKLPWNLMTVQRWKRKRLSSIPRGSALQGAEKRMTSPRSDRG